MEMESISFFFYGWIPFLLPTFKDGSERAEAFENFAKSLILAANFIGIHFHCISEGILGSWPRLSPALLCQFG